MDTFSQLVRYSIVLVLMIFMLGAALIIGAVSPDAGWRIYRCWNSMALRVFGIEVESRFDGDPSQYESGGVIVGLTQQSLLDPTIGYAVWDKRVRAIWNIEYALIPFFGWISVLVGWVIIRQRPEQAKRQLKKAVKHAAGGGLVYLSAEGQRSIDGSLNPYKKGPIVLAIESQASIHPIYIAGSRACMPVGEWKIRPGKVVIHYLQPISTTGLSYDDRDVLLGKVREVGASTHEYWTQKPTDSMSAGKPNATPAD